MTSKLLKRISALRGINPRLNAVTDEVTEIITTVEKTLVDELKIGIDASQWFQTEFGGEEGNSREYYLSFNRVGAAGFRIHVAILTVRDTSEETGKAGTREMLNEERILWTSCGREIKLKAFEKLPELLDSIISGAESLAQTADLTATKIKQMVSDEAEETEETDEPEEIEETDEPEETWRRGQSRRRVYTVKDAARAHRQYFEDQGMSETALATVTFNVWKEDGPGGFVSRDAQGKARCAIVFVDEDRHCGNHIPRRRVRSGLDRLVVKIAVDLAALGGIGGGARVFVSAFAVPLQFVHSWTWMIQLTAILMRSAACANSAGG